MNVTAASELEVCSEDVHEAVLDLSERLVYYGLVFLIFLLSFKLLSIRLLYDSFCIFLLLSDDTIGDRESFLWRLNFLDFIQLVFFLENF